METPAFDKPWMLAQIGGDEALLHEVAHIFLSDVARLEKGLQEALVTSDDRALHAAAHAAKSAVGNFGARDAVEAAKALEVACKAGERYLYPALHRTLWEEVKRLEAELKLELGAE